MAFNWTCPHCDRAQSVTDQRYDLSVQHVGVQKIAEGNLYVSRSSIGCSNRNCEKISISISVKNGAINDYGRVVLSGEPLFDLRILPFGSSKEWPIFIPVALRDDYREACLIRDLSPKASATLTRRCLQGMIRDFCGISRSTLFQEIDDLRKSVGDGSADRAISIETVDAIDHVRSVGNIGAHMERDIDHIVPVDPGEAQILIDLVELLFEEWYVARESRKQKFAALAGVAAGKAELRTGVSKT